MAADTRTHCPPTPDGGLRAAEIATSGACMTVNDRIVAGWATEEFARKVTYLAVPKVVQGSIDLIRGIRHARP